MKDRHAGHAVVDAAEYAGEDLAKLLAAPIDTATPSTDRTRIHGVVVGALVGFADAGATPLVTYREQPGTAAVPARLTVAVHASHIGKQTVLMFGEGDPQRPIIVGCPQDEAATGLPVSGQGHVEADGRHLFVSPADRMVRGCGNTSIT